MDIKVGNIYVDLDDKDIVKIIKVESERVYFKIIKDPANVWVGEPTETMSISTFMAWYIPMGKLAEAIYL